MTTEKICAPRSHNLQVIRALIKYELEARNSVMVKNDWPINQNIGWPIRTWPKQSIITQRFIERKLENKVALESCETRNLPYSFSNKTLFKWWSSQCIPSWALFFILSLRALLTSEPMHIFLFADSFFQLCDSLGFLLIDSLFKLTTGEKVEGWKIWKPSWPINFPNIKITFH